MSYNIPTKILKCTILVGLICYSMASLKFYLENPRCKDYAYIRCRLKLKPGVYHRFYIPGEKIPVAYWNIKAQRIKENHRNAASINTFLDTIAYRIENKRRTALMDGSLSIHNMKIYIDDLLGKKSTDFWGTLDMIIKQKEAVTTSSDRNNNGKQYRNIKNKLQAYNSNLTFSDINNDFYHRWITYLYEVHEININTADRYIKMVKTFMREASKRGYHQNTAYLDYKVKTVPASLPYFSLEELDLLFKYRAKQDNLENTRINLLKGCYTGQRFSDWHKITANNIIDINGAQYINISQQKTKNQVLLPAHSKLKSILQIDHHSVSLQNFNKNVKVLCKDAKLDSPFIKHTYKSGKYKQMVYKKHEVTSSHIGRRSFACNSILQGLNTELIMKVGGWKDYSSFQRYVQLSSTDGLEQFEAAFN